MSNQGKQNVTALTPAELEELIERRDWETIPLLIVRNIRKYYFIIFSLVVAFRLFPITNVMFYLLPLLGGSVDYALAKLSWSFNTGASRIAKDINQSIPAEIRQNSVDRFLRSKLGLLSFFLIVGSVLLVYYISFQQDKIDLRVTKVVVWLLAIFASSVFAIVPFFETSSRNTVFFEAQPDYSANGLVVNGIYPIWPHNTYLIICLLIWLPFVFFFSFNLFEVAQEEYSSVNIKLDLLFVVINALIFGVIDKVYFVSKLLFIAKSISSMKGA